MVATCYESPSLVRGAMAEADGVIPLGLKGLNLQILRPKPLNLKPFCIQASKP